MTEPDEGLVRHVARLAGLQLSPDEVADAAGTSARLLAAFRVLAEHDVEGLAPLVTPADGEPAPSPPSPPPAGAARPADLLAAAPEVVEGHFAVPRVVGEAP